MINVNSTGRWIGAGILASFFVGMTSNFYLQPMIRTGEGAMGLFAGAAGQPQLIGSIVLMELVTAAISLATAALLCQISAARPFAWLSFLYLGLLAAKSGMSGSELASYQLYRDLGVAMLADPTGALAQLAEPIKALVTGQRDGLHYPHLLTSGAGIFALYVLLFQSRWVPRWLSTAGMLAAVSQMIGVFTGILGADVSFYFLAPLALVHLITGSWLTLRGFSGDTAR